jgi:hypothetical protein
MIYEVTKRGIFFNQVAILSNSLEKSIGRVKYNTLLGPQELYISSYLLHVVCSCNSWIGLGWSWSLEKPHVHVYFKDLCKHTYKYHFSLICDGFLAPFYELIFYVPCPRISSEVVEVLKNIRDWYQNEHSTYIRVYGAR